jgi:hypothetical protein
MDGINRLRCNLAMATCLMFATIVFSQEQAKVDRPAIEALINKLASTNKDPNPRPARPFVRLPKDYDYKAQQIVSDAEEKLKSMGKDAFPILIEHFNDERYSKSMSTSLLRSFTVGEICQKIIENQVDLAGMNYKMRIGADGNFHPFSRNYFAKYYAQGATREVALKKWWEENQQQSLKEMQIVGLRSAIEHERKIGFATKEDEASYLTPLVEKLKALEK